MSTVQLEINEWVTAAEAARMAGVTPGRIRQLARAGQIRRVDITEAVKLYHAQSVRDWAKRPRGTGGRPRTADQ